MRIVVDTNIFVSAIMNADGAPRQIIRLCLQERHIALMGNALLAEYEDVCGRPALSAKLPMEDQVGLLEAFVSCCTWIPIYYLWRPNLSDEADNHLVELAVAGGASAIITANKKDFARAELLFPDLRICSAGEFLALKGN